MMHLYLVKKNDTFHCHLVIKPYSERSMHIKHHNPGRYEGQPVFQSLSCEANGFIGSSNFAYGLVADIRSLWKKQHFWLENIVAWAYKSMETHQRGIQIQIRNFPSSQTLDRFWKTCCFYMGRKKSLKAECGTNIGMSTEYRGWN